MAEFKYLTEKQFDGLKRLLDEEKEHPNKVIRVLYRPVRQRRAESGLPLQYNTGAFISKINDDFTERDIFELSKSTVNTLMSIECLTYDNDLDTPPASRGVHYRLSDDAQRYFNVIDKPLPLDIRKRLHSRMDDYSKSILEKLVELTKAYPEEKYRIVTRAATDTSRILGSYLIACDAGEMYRYQLITEYNGKMLSSFVSRDLMERKDELYGETYGINEEVRHLIAELVEKPYFESYDRPTWGWVCSLASRYKCRVIRIPKVKLLALESTDGRFIPNPSITVSKSGKQIFNITDLTKPEWEEIMLEKVGNL